MTSVPPDESSVADATSTDGNEKVTDKPAVASAIRCFDSVLAILVPLVYGLVYGADTSWHWTALYSWTFFFICHPVVKTKVVCSLVVWSILAFITWIVFFAISKSMAFIYVGLYFLLNGLLLFAVSLRSICQRRNVEGYESI